MQEIMQCSEVKCSHNGLERAGGRCWYGATLTMAVSVRPASTGSFSSESATLGEGGGGGGAGGGDSSHWSWRLTTEHMATNWSAGCATNKGVCTQKVVWLKPDQLYWWLQPWINASHYTDIYIYIHGQNLIFDLLKVGISGYGNLRTMGVYKWATSKATQLSTKVWVKLLLLP